MDFHPLGRAMIKGNSDEKCCFKFYQVEGINENI